MVLDCFSIISSSRQIGFGILQPITLSEIFYFTKMFQIDMEYDIFVSYIKYLDQVFLKRVNKKK